MNIGKHIYELLGGANFEASTGVNGIFLGEDYFQCFISRNVMFIAKLQPDFTFTVSLSKFSTKDKKWKVTKMDFDVENNKEALSKAFTNMTGMRTIL